MNVLVVAAHPDDEILGCGGSIAKHVALGDLVHVLIIAEGATSRVTSQVEHDLFSELANLRNAAQEASSILGVSSCTLAGLPDNRLDSIDRLDLVQLIESHVILTKPEIVYVHHSSDLNVDHRRIHESVVTACRPLPNATTKTIISFETLSSTEWQSTSFGTFFNPNYFVDISPYLETKLLALKCYQSEMRDWPHPRSYEAVRTQALYRGSQVGLHAAEAFVLIRSVVCN